MTAIKKEWKFRRFKKWTFEYEVYSETTEYEGIELKKGRITAGGLALKNIKHAGYRFAFDLRTHAIWLYAGKMAKEDGYCAKKLRLGPIDFEQLPMLDSDPNSFGPILFDKGYSNENGETKADFGSVSGIPYNFETFSQSVEGELLIRWKSRHKIFGPKSDYIYVSQKIIFTKYSSVPSHEPNGALTAARIHPMIRVQYGNKNDGYFDRVRFDYRMHLNVDKAPVFVQADDPTIGRFDVNQKNNHVGIFRDDDEADMDSVRDFLDIDVAPIVFEAAEKPIVAEVIGQGIWNGKNRTSEGYYTWDNIHYWGAGGNIHASAPGDFHGIHLHWRWGEVLRNPGGILTPEYAGSPQYKGKGNSGLLVDPYLKNQTLQFAIISKMSLLDGLSYFSESWNSFSDFFTASHKLAEFNPCDETEFSYPMRGDQVQPLKIGTQPQQGDNLITYYSCTVHKDQDTMGENKNLLRGYIFLHGIFFGHEPELPQRNMKLDYPMVAGIGSHDTFYLNPVEVNIDKTNWFRNPKVK